MPVGWQIIIRRRDDAILAPGVAARRCFARTIARVARGMPLLSFNAAAGHGHLQIAGCRAQAGELARRIQLSLGHHLGHARQLEPARLRPVHDQRHQQHLFRYILDQTQHHGLPTDPFHDASALPDLLGLRVTGAWMRAVVGERLPTLRLHALADRLDFDPFVIDTTSLDGLADAAAAALGEVSLGDRSPRALVGRAAAVRVAAPGFGTTALAQHLQVSTRTVQRLLRRPVTEALLTAVRGQWSLRTRVAAATAGDAAGATPGDAAGATPGDTAADTAGDVVVSPAARRRLRG